MASEWHKKIQEEENFLFWDMGKRARDYPIVCLIELYKLQDFLSILFDGV